MAAKSFIFDILSFKKVSWNRRYTHNYSKIHKYSDVFMNTNNHECLGSDLGYPMKLVTCRSSLTWTECGTCHAATLHTAPRNKRSGTKPCVDDTLLLLLFPRLAQVNHSQFAATCGVQQGSQARRARRGQPLWILSYGLLYAFGTHSPVRLSACSFEWHA